MSTARPWQPPRPQPQPLGVRGEENGKQLGVFLYQVLVKGPEED